MQNPDLPIWCCVRFIDSVFNVSVYLFFFLFKSYLALCDHLIIYLEFVLTVLFVKWDTVCV